MLHAYRQYHLALPERDRIDKRRLYFFGHRRIVALYHTYLRRHLHCHRAGQLQIVNLFFKTVAQLRQILCLLCILRKPAQLGTSQKLRKLFCAYLFQLFLSRKDVHGQLFIIGQIQLIHLIQHSRILQQLYLMPLQYLTDTVYIFLCFGILCFHIRKLIRILLKKSQKAFFFFLFVYAL